MITLLSKAQLYASVLKTPNYVAKPSLYSAFENLQGRSGKYKDWAVLWEPNHDLYSLELDPSKRLNVGHTLGAKKDSAGNQVCQFKVIGRLNVSLSKIANKARKQQDIFANHQHRETLKQQIFYVIDQFCQLQSKFILAVNNDDLTNKERIKYQLTKEITLEWIEVAKVRLAELR